MNISSKVASIIQQNFNMGDCFKNFAHESDECERCHVKKECKKATQNKDESTLDDVLGASHDSGKDARKSHAESGDVIEELSTILDFQSNQSGKKSDLYVFTDDQEREIKVVITKNKKSMKTVSCLGETFYDLSDRKKIQGAVKEIGRIFCVDE